MAILKKVFSIILRVSISILLLVFLLRQVDIKALLEIIKNTDKLLLFFAFLIFFMIYVLCLLRWDMLLRAVGIRLPFKRVFISYSGGVFFSLFLPSTIGGDLMRSIDLSAHTHKPKEVIATIILDRLSGYVGLVILAILSLVFGWRLIQDASTLFSIFIITAILIAILLVLFNKSLYNLVQKLLSSPNAGKIRELIISLHEEMHVFRHKRKIIISNLILSIIIQSMPPLSFFVIAQAMGIKIKLIYFFIFLPIIGAITLLPISIGGLGLRDVTTIFFLAKAGISKNSALAMSLLNFSFILICGALGGLIYVLTVRHRRQQYHTPSELQSTESQ